MKVTTLPGVFAPRSDSWLLVRTLAAQALAAGASVLDVCTGSGALAVAAALQGAGDVTAVDISRRAVLTTRLNARRNRVWVHALRGDLFAPVAGRRFDAIVSNPPYVPSPDDDLPRHGATRAWEGGADGRALVDRICAQAPDHLQPGGVLLLVHSSVTGLDQTHRTLTAAGLQAHVAARHHGPIGPLLQQRAEMLTARGLLQGDQEELVVVRAVKPA